MPIASELPKAYDPSSCEDGIYAAWEKEGFFNPDRLPERNQRGEPYAIVMPPPNRTGTLHLGHATMLAIEDLLIRFHRLRGKKTLWIPGTDHAAIATQVKVEQQLVHEGIKDPRQTLGREKFLECVVAFADASSRTIRAQIRKMGSSCDWSRERYTFDEERNRAVYQMFKMMHEDGLIERGSRIVNWDPKTQTVVSDDEVEWAEETAPFYYLQYGPFVIGTSRPETKFGDKYVVIHPDDERYSAYRDGQTVELEWINGPITATVIKDPVIDREFGTGVMTITPWHDAVDFELAERHHLSKEQIIDLQGRLLPIAGEFAGLPIEEARQGMIDKLRDKGLLVRIDEKYVHRKAVSQRGGGVIEPQILRQWFVRVNKPFALHQDTFKRKKGTEATLKELMREAVFGGHIRMVPERFEKMYFHWIDALRDWCISRQIWFGHRIPVWYKDEEMRVGDTSPGTGWTQDPDTLDTWFSSGMWSFSALGWPDGKEWKAHRTYHPTAVLETGYDILFFWVARMVLMSAYAIGEVPFRDVYLHGLVRDERGKKMSKSLGNALDPLDLIPKYGTDAVRLSLLIGTAPGQDMRLSEQKIEGFRNFTNKLWNISRYILGMRNETLGASKAERTLADRWILARMNATTASVTKKFEAYQFSSAGEELRDFTWGDLADWYLEIAKAEGGKQEILTHLLKHTLILWHPFMPFVTERIWQLAGFEGMLMVAEWPRMSEGTSPQPSSLGSVRDRPLQGEGEVDVFDRLRAVVTAARRLRVEQGHALAASPLTFLLKGDGEWLKTAAKEFFWMERLSGANVKFEIVSAIGNGCVTAVGNGYVVGVPKNPIKEISDEARRKKEKENLADHLVSLERQLSNKEFLSRAPARVVEQMREKKEDAFERLRILGEEK